MCLYPKLIRNPKYIPNKKNGGRPPKCTDKRTLLVPVGCQKCMECMKQKARGWQIRLLEEIKGHDRGKKHFITLTLSNESIKELSKEVDKEGYERDNGIASLAVRRFLERWRAKYGKSMRHWLITELGHNGTENVHLHGILFTDKIEEVAKVWKYGYVWKGTYVNDATVNYIIKYCTKQDLKHTQYRPKIHTSSGIGAQYTHTQNARLNTFKKDGTTQELYRNRQGYKMALPTYYRNKLYTEDQREKLWIEKLEKKERWVDGSRVSIEHGDQEYYKVLTNARRKNQRLGYGNDDKNWNKTEYENERRDYLHGQRTGTDRTNSMETDDIPQMDRRRHRQTNPTAQRIAERYRTNAERLTTQT